MLFFRFLSFWFRVCSAFGSPVGSVLAFPFFRSLVPPCWSFRGGRWVRSWPPASCGRPAFSSGFRGRWVCVPASFSVAAARRLPLSSPWFPWAVFPAVVSRRGGFVFSLWVFVTQSEKGAFEVGFEARQVREPDELKRGKNEIVTVETIEKEVQK